MKTTLYAVLVAALTWHCGDSTAASGDGAASVDSAANDTVAQAQLRVFVTDIAYSADLATAAGLSGGLEGADALCQLNADAAQLGGVFKAWISDATVDAIDRIAGDGPWANLDGDVVFNNRANLATAPALALGYRRPPVPGGTTAGPDFREVWTGTAAGGRASGTACSGWTSASVGQGGTAGQAAAQNGQWTDVGQISCGANAHLYCFEQ